MKLQVEKVATKEQIEEIVNSEVLTKSGKIKELFNLGLEVKEISNVTGLIYNMCYNVITNYVLTNGLQVIKEKKVSKKDVVFDLFDQGKSNMEVAKETQTNYNYICKLKKEWKMNKEALQEAGQVSAEVVAQVAEQVQEEVQEEVAVTEEVKEEVVEHPLFPRKNRKAK